MNPVYKDVLCSYIYSCGLHIWGDFGSVMRGGVEHRVFSKVPWLPFCMNCVSPNFMVTNFIDPKKLAHHLSTTGRRSTLSSGSSKTVLHSQHLAFHLSFVHLKRVCVRVWYLRVCLGQGDEPFGLPLKTKVFHVKIKDSRGIQVNVFRTPFKLKYEVLFLVF